MIRSWHVYYRDGRFFVPIVAITEAGFFLDVNPVETVSRSTDDAVTIEGLARVIKSRLEVGNPVVVTPPATGSAAIGVVAIAAGLKSWNSFEKRSICWGIVDEGSQFWEIDMSLRATNGRWAPGPGSVTKVSKDLGAEEIGRLIVSQLSSREDV